MDRKEIFVLGATLMLVAGCAQMPTGPTVQVMPAPNKPLEVFEAENTFCKDYARRQLGTNPNELQQQQVSGAVAGTALGAAAGALLGGGRGAGFGAGAGLLMGTAAGTNAADESRWSLQRRYNIAYMQCMYSKGNQVPGYYNYMRNMPAPPPPPPPPG